MSTTPFLDAGTHLSFSAEAKVLADAVRGVKSLAGDHVVITSNGKSTFIIGHAKTGALVAKPLPIRAEGKGHCPLIADTFLPLVDKRKGEMQFTYDGKEIMFKGKPRFSGSIKVAPLTEGEISVIQETLSLVPASTVSLEDIEANLLWKTIDAARIKDALYNQELTRYIQARKGTLTVTSFDNLHMAMCVATGTKIPDFKAALTDDKLDAVRKVHGDGRISLSMTPSVFAASGPNGVMSLPPLQSSDSHWTTVQELVNRPTKVALTVTLKPERLLNSINNLCSIYESNASVEVHSSPKGLHMTLTTAHGQVSDAIPCESVEGQAKFSLEPLGMKNILSLLPDALVKIEITPKSQYKVIASKGTVYLGSLHD